jgi:lysyl-tRNA synthetase class II
MTNESPSHYEQERRQKLARLREIGVDPYGGRTAGIQALGTVKSQYKPEMGHDGGPEVTVAGRVMLKRDMGKLSFLTLRDESGDLQVALDKKRLSERDWQVRDLIDLGDLLVVSGKLGQTNKGETTVWAAGVSISSKALLPPPAKWEGLSDVELRYRQRYIDLWANPDVMRVLKLRIEIVKEVRQFLASKGFVEVETPMMQTLAGGAAAKPFVTHHNALDIPLYMRIAPELYLKRLLVGGFSKVFELNRNFRNEGISPRHNPEFTMLEVYEAYGSWETMADLVEELIVTVAQKVLGTLEIAHANGRKINLTRPWRRATVAELFEEATGKPFQKTDIRGSDPTVVLDLLASRIEGRLGHALGIFRKLSRNLPTIVQKIKNGLPLTSKEQELFEKERSIFGDAFETTETDEQRREVKEMYRLLRAPQKDEMDKWYSQFASAFIEVGYKRINDVLDKMSPAEQLTYFYEKVIEPTLIDPCFVKQIPSVMIPLARKNAADPFFADVYELAINGVEISPGYSELNDPDMQAQNFAHQVGDKEEQQKVDEDFLNALRVGMPPAGGLGLGIDRMVMMLTGAESIRDVILFPLMKPELE